MHHIEPVHRKIASTPLPSCYNLDDEKVTGVNTSLEIPGRLLSLNKISQELRVCQPESVFHTVGAVIC